MTAQLSRERLEEKLLEHIKHGGDSEEETMIRMLLARLDNKPVAWIVHARQGDMLTSDGNFVANAEGISSIRSTPLYAAPPAPVAVPVPDERAALESFMAERFGDCIDRRRVKNGDGEYMAWDMQVAWIVWQRRAMLKAGPVTAATVPDDTKRLDWLDVQNKRLNEYYGTSYGWKFDANFQRNAMMLNDSNYPVMTVRQAIDEAMLAAAPAAPEQEL